ncbi:hypothetical protein KY092_12725 [Natronomonas gomsonensis]|uniref:hypothetical protein n=1 Tax=Natronomonas gomsonensis TaxID=1046043 RepID=UPI0020CA8A45|nr:hypothetical protein [Natronomonas gomsonensis]MCY4731416.1 hypothetical protein [Natronomonas gomsonensis]
MERRKFLIGAGSAAVGASALVGSGAFTSVSAERTVSVNVADDNNAYLALDPTTGKNSVFADKSDSGEVSVTLDNSGEGGQGINQDAKTKVHELFEVKNQGTEGAIVYVPPTSVTIGGTQVLSGINGTIQTNDYIDPQATNRPYGSFSNNNQIEDEVSLTAIFGEYYDGDSTSWEEAATSIYGSLNNFKLLPGDSFSFGLVVDESADDTDASFGDVKLTLAADTTMI